MWCSKDCKHIGISVMISGRLWPSIVAALSLLTAVQCELQSDGKSTYRQADMQCVPDDSPGAIARSKAISTTQCVVHVFMKALTGALVIQFNSDTKNCAVFNFQSICRSLIPGKSANCELFYRFPIDHRSMNAKLNNVWLADDVSRLENLVCQADENTNRLFPVNIQWSSDGAVFDGSTSYAVLNKSSINFATGLTWLMRIKRQPNVQPFFDFADCSDMSADTARGIHMWEHQTSTQVYVRANKITGTLLPFIYSPVSTLPASSEDWINIGVTANGGAFDLFVKDSFLPRSSLYLYNDPDPCTINNANACLYLGMRVESYTPTPLLFNGTMRAVALASASMSEAEIREFFDLVG